MKVVVGSRNPVKIKATRSAFQKVWPKKKWEVIGLKILSGVSDQPMSDKESIKGATNRAKRAIKRTKAGFGVGMEGGLQKIRNKWYDCGWMVVLDRKGTTGIGTTVRNEVPPKMMKLLKKGKELGEVDDIMFGKNNSKQGNGHFGLMTNNLITRESGYVDGLIMALTRFIHPKLWE